jgi:rSAM/selenodomain-associated transferase 1
MRGDTVIVFARAPRLGAVKRRLARGIGAMAALRFYRAQLAATLREARDKRWRTVIAATPDRARVRWPRGITVLPQGHGDLGQRMGRALARHRRAVLVGCDVPHLARADIAAAFRALGRAQAVFGPAEDGGYWLVGLGPRRPAQPFAAVRWSGPHALGDTLANFRGANFQGANFQGANFHGRHIALLRTLRDVDTAEDLAALSAKP